MSEIASALDLGEHAGFIWASYAVAAGVVLAVTATLVVQRNRLQAKLVKLEREAGRRR